jgi:hypothetical protein
MKEHESVHEVRRLIANLAAANVVDLQRVRELKHRLKLLRAGRNWEALMAWLEELQRENAESLCELGAALLYDWIAHAATTCSAQGTPAATAVTAWLVERGET